MPEQVEIQRDPLCREHGTSRYQYQEGHVGDSRRVERRPVPEFDWEPTPRPPAGDNGYITWDTMSLQWTYTTPVTVSRADFGGAA